MSTVLQGISSMATRQVLADLLADWHAQGGASTAIESLGGVEAAQKSKMAAPTTWCFWPPKPLMA